MIEDLAGLLAGLRYQGLQVGPDDAARIVVAFRHAEAWSHAQRVRMLKALVARSDEERAIIDRLAPLLFIHARVERKVESEAPQLGVSRVQDAASGGTRDRKAQEESVVFDSMQAPAWRNRASFWVLLSVGFLGGIIASRATDFDLIDFLRLLLEGGANPANGPLLNKPDDAVWPLWVYLLLGLLSSVVASHVFFRFFRARTQQRNVERLAASIGPRTYAITPPPGAEQPLAKDAIREAAFSLSAPSQDVAAPWLDVERTVRATMRSAGRLVLRHASLREQRPVLLIEDAAPSMTRWPLHGTQLARALHLQGAVVVHRYMKGFPGELSPDRTCLTQVPLEHELAQLENPIIVVLSDAAAVHPERDQHTWISVLSSAIWLHPRPMELWDFGARWLSRSLRVVPMSEDRLLRLGAVFFGHVGDIPPRWRAPRGVSRHAHAELKLCRCALGEEAFLWLAAGAVFDRVAALTTRLWWALRSEEVTPPAPWERIERVWELEAIQVGVHGNITFRDDLREELIAVLLKERGDVLSRVVSWAEQLISRDLLALPADSPAALAARITRARLLFLDPQRAAESHRELCQLSREGFGAMMALIGSAEERQDWGVELERLRGPRRLTLAVGAIAVLLIIGSGIVLWTDPHWGKVASRSVPDTLIFISWALTQTLLTVSVFSKAFDHSENGATGYELES